MNPLKQLTSQHSSACPATFTALVHAAQGGEEVLFVDTSLLCLTQLIGEDVQHELTVTISVDVAVGFQVQVALQLWSIDQVAIVSQADTVGAVNVEGLGLCIGAATSSRVPEVANTHSTREVSHLCTVMEDLSRHAVGL